MNIYVAGSSGWAGTDFFSKTKNIYNIIDLGDPLSSSNFFDIRFEKNYHVFKNVKSEDVLINFIGMIHPDKFSDFYAINTKGVAKLFELFIKNGGKKIIHISSNSLVGFNTNKDPFDSNSIVNPYMQYGKTKVFGEYEILKTALFNKVSVIILRVPWLHGGTNQPSRQKQFYEMILSGKFPIPFNCNNIRSILNVENLSYAIQACLKNWKSGIYWIYDNPNMNFKTYLDLIKETAINLGIKNVKKGYIFLPNIAFNFFRITDHFLQSFGIYSTKIHVLGEINLDIFINDNKFFNNFPNCNFIAIEDAVKKSLKKHFIAN